MVRVISSRFRRAEVLLAFGAVILVFLFVLLNLPILLGYLGFHVSSIFVFLALVSTAVVLFRLHPAGLTRRTLWVAVLVALCGAANPVTLTQLFTFYIDGQLAALFGCLLALTACWLREPSPLVSIALLSALGLMIHVKLSGLVYAGCWAACVFL